jgi:hypothetical protein
MKITLKGNMGSRQVWLNGKPLTPERSLKEINHSPDGFCWGYGGSGPAQLALAVLLELYTKERALAGYQKFKSEVIAALPQSDFEEQIEIQDPEEGQ